jgi:hypothetical protein
VDLTLVGAMLGAMAMALAMAVVVALPSYAREAKISFKKPKDCKGGRPKSFEKKNFGLVIKKFQLVKK